MSCNNNLYLVSRHVISPKENPSHPAVTSHLHFLLLGVYLFWKFLINGIILYVRLPRRLSSKESACQCKRYELNPWIGKIPWRRKWQLTPAFSPGKFHGQRSLVCYSPWGCKESDTTERLSLRTVCDLLYLTCFTEHHVFQVHPRCAVYQNFISFYE